MLYTDDDLGRLLSAVRFSASKHQHQRRKDEAASPYINHPVEVAGLLWQVGGVGEIPILVAALLHDTLEDTETSPQEIRSQFGEEVLALVQEVTDDKSLPKEERKLQQVLHAPNRSPGAKLIKLADKICNVRDVTHNPPRHWPLERRQEYLDWTERVVAGLRGVNPALETLYDQTLTEGRRLLGDTGP
jgi:guanosine-3',5'-bis(diphosphate) 3'-pyrophosphohydrolase